MLTKTKLETPQDLPEEKAAADENTAEGEDYPFYILPPPPIPGQTSWSIVPW